MAIRYVNVTDTIGDTGASTDTRIVFGDFDNDGDLDILFSATSGGTVGYKRNEGNGTYVTFADATAAGLPFAGIGTLPSIGSVLYSPVHIVDYDNDGDVDLVSRLNNNTSILNNTNGVFSIATDTIGDTGPTTDQRVVFGDFDGDGDLDILYQTGNVAGQDIGYKRNDGNGTYTTFANANTAGTPFATVSFANVQVVSGTTLHALDYDNDGDIDLINRNNNATSILRNDNGTFVTGTDTIGDTGATTDQRVVFGDFDSDGDIDILYQTGGTAGQGIGYKRNEGNGTYTDFADATVAGSAFEGADLSNVQVSSTFLQVVDYDNDGDVDLISRNLNITRIIAQGSNTGNGAPPRLASSTPSDNGTAVSVSANIVLTFDESVSKGTGNIQIVRTSDSVVVETIAVGSAQVTGSGTTWTIDPSITLASNTGYAVRIAAGAFADGDGAIYKGIANLTTLNFVTAAAAVAPTITASGGSAAFTEGANVASTPVAVDAGITVGDADSTTLASATVSITTGFQSGQDVLAFTANAGLFGNISGSYVAGTGVLTLTSAGATATVAQFQAALRSVTYTNTSDTPNTAPRTISFVANDGTVGSAAATRTVTVAAVDDAPVAVANAGAVNENATVNLDVVFNDTDVDGGPKAVASVNGTAATVGNAIALASGATVTLQANGTLTYNPSGAFNALVSAATGAATGATNTSATDSFTYALNGGSSATVTVTVNGVDSTGDRLGGNGGNNTLTGTPAADFFDLSQGGNDSVSGGDGNDSFFFGAEFTGADSVNGGTGTNDQLGLQGNYVLTLGAAQVTGIEAIALLGTNAYAITTLDDLVGAGQELTIYAGAQTGGSFSFNGSAETNGSFRIFGGAGTESITTGAGNDSIYFGPGTFVQPQTVINAGAGTNDQVALDGDYTLSLSVGNLQNVEVLALLRGTTANLADYNISFDDTVVAPGGTFTVYAVAVETGAILNASVEQSGSYRFFGGSGGDTITGGGGADWIWGNLGNDTLRGNGGADRFHFTGATAGNVDTIADFTSVQGDRIELVGGAFGLGSGSLSASAFVVGTAATTAAHRIIYNSATGGLFYDADGNGAGAAIQFATLTGAPTLATTDFVIV